MADAPKLTRPVVNLNGTSRQALFYDRRMAYLACQELIEALQACAPHGRDYPGDALGLAADRAVHFARVETIIQLRNALKDEAVAIRQQEDNQP